MAMDPKKLQAFAGGDDGGDAPAGGQPSKQEMEDALSQANEGSDTEEEGEGKYSDLIPLLERDADDVQSSIEELPPEILLDGIQVLQPDLVGELKSSLSQGIEEDDAQAIADHLETEGMYDDGSKLAGWLIRVASVAGQIEEPEQEEAPDEENETDQGDQQPGEGDEEDDQGGEGE
jgi:hypothetical protein